MGKNKSNEHNNIHDETFKLALSNPKQVTSLLTEYLPKKIVNTINMASIRVESGSFIDSEYKEHHADILCSFQFLENNVKGLLYILFEHKSYKDNKTPVQLLRYMVNIWSNFLIKNPKAKIPVILPIIIYHGKINWEIPEYFIDIVDNITETARYVPNFEIESVNLGKISDNQIRGINTLKIVLWSFKHIFDKNLLNQLVTIKGFVNEILDKQNGIEYIDIVFSYISRYKKISDDEMLVFLKSKLNIGDEKMELMSERFRQKGIAQGLTQGLTQGLAQGLEKGRMEGKIEGRLEAIKVALKSKFGRKGLVLIDKIRRINDPKQLDGILSEIIMASDLEEIRNKV